MVQKETCLIQKLQYWYPSGLAYSPDNIQKIGKNWIDLEKNG